MKKDKDNRKGSDKEGAAKQSEPAPSQTSLVADKKITLRESESGIKSISRDFPGPRDADVPLRIAVDKKAYAELIAHAKESLDREVCGVLAGHLCEDDEGLFISVEASIRGTAASEASTHVTFTQATWNAIHKVLEEEFPKLKIVGWYHTHPGFGVEFSDMDLFIQKNFFSGSTQIALVTDPLNGAVAICVNGEEGAKYLTRFWVDGREQQARVPAREAGAQGLSGASSSDSASGEAPIQRLEARVAQLVQALDEQRRSSQNFLLFCGSIFCFAVILTAGYFIWGIYSTRAEPPRAHFKVGDKELSIPLDVMKQFEDLKLTLVPVEIAAQMAALKAELERAALSMPGATNPSANPAPALTTNAIPAPSSASGPAKPDEAGTPQKQP